uniref:Enhancer of mRNA-decapping protein 4 n=1 Tax=Cacopsylla melanoneura TaxID=428564 RepID=A0A8D8YSG2_9HEMI
MSDKDKTWKLKLNKSENIVINSNEHSEYFREISSHHVDVNLGFKASHLESSSCMNLTDMVRYSWPQVKSTENLIAVHQSGKYIAYGIFISNTIWSVRIHDVESDSRHRVDDLYYPVADLAFVSSYEELMLAVIDVKGNVFIYNLYFLNGQFHYERYLEVTASETSAPGPYKLVWYAGDKESSIPRALAVTRGKKIEIWNLESIYSSHKKIAKTSALPISILREHIIEMNQHNDLVTRVCFSVDGAAVATASLDGSIMFFQILDLDEPNVPKPLHSWEPHGGAPVTHMLLLDNYEDDVFWRFLVSFSNDNSVLKIWSCESWLCLQTFSFHAPSPGDVIHMIPYVDRYSKYIYLSDCHNKVFYVLELFSDPERPIAYVFKFAAFLVISPILSIHVNSCDVVLRRNPGDTGLMLSGGDDNDIHTDFDDLRGRDLNILHDNRIRLYILSPKSLQNCELLFPSLPIVPDSSRMILVDDEEEEEEMLHFFHIVEIVYYDLEHFEPHCRTTETVGFVTFIPIIKKENIFTLIRRFYITHLK